MGNKFKTPLFLFFLFVVFLSSCKENIKEPAVAGAFYPSDEKILRETVTDFISRAEKREVKGTVIALISPHAGYQFSGHVAGYSYRHLSEREINTVILIGPSHHRAFKGASVYTKGMMKTPLGNVKIDEGIAKSFINEKADVHFYPDAFEKEHSLEVQLPFLQMVLKDFKIVPILISSPTRESFEFLTDKITETLRKNHKAILIASTDLSHYHDYNTAVMMDRKVIDAIERMSIDDIERLLTSGEGEMCGGYPVIFTMAIARNLEATNGVLYKYANSGDVTYDHGRVVGYAAIGLYRSDFSKDEKDFLLNLARDAIVSHVLHKKVIDIDITNPLLRANMATFVTINRGGHLRGCIGNTQPYLPLYRSVITNAISASTKDPRFPPITPDELKDIEVEISILSPFEPVRDVKEITVGKHGLYLIKGQNSGLLLPQVATEYGWDRNTFLEQVSIKAGLPKDAWKDSKLYIFSAYVIK